MTADRMYDANWTSRAIGRPGIITGHNAGSLAWSRRPFLEREVACPPSSSSCTGSSADGRSQLEGVESSVRRSHGRSRRLSRTSEPRAQLQRPLPSRITRTWLHPALQDESHPAAADLYIIYILSPPRNSFRMEKLTGFKARGGVERKHSSQSLPPFKAGLYVRETVREQGLCSCSFVFVRGSFARFGW